MAEAAEILKVSTDTDTRMFADEPGVIDLGTPEQSHKRRYRVLRIPHAVFNRVIHKRACAVVRVWASSSFREQCQKGRSSY